MHQAVCLNYWHTAWTSMHIPQDMPQELSSRSPSPEQTIGGTQYYIGAMTAWSSIPHQVTDARCTIRFKKQIKKTPYGTVGTVKQHKHWCTHTHTHDNIRTIYIHMDLVP